MLFLKINIFSRKGDLPQVEAGLRKLTELYPTVPRFRSQLVQFYLQNKRQDDALNTLRSVVAANPGDTNAELDLVNLLAAVKGPAAARAELARAHQGRHRRVSPTRLRWQGLTLRRARPTTASSFCSSSSPRRVRPRKRSIAKNTLANIYLAQNNIAPPNRW